MKKNIFQMLLLIATVIMTAACSSDNDITNEPKQPTTAETTSTPITITASYGDGTSTTRVSYSESGNTISATWEADDQLYVVYDGYVSTLTLTSGAGTASATFNGTISYRTTPTANSILYCFVKDKNNTSAVTVEGDRIIYSDAAFQSQDGTLAGAAKCNTYSGSTTYGTGTDLKCNFAVNTSMCKFNLTNVGGNSGSSATVEYKSGSTTLASATITVTSGDNLVYLAVPVGSYSGEQKLVFTCGTKTKEYTLSSTQANFVAGHTYSKDIFFAIEGGFSVSNSKIVYFSKGNLQYKNGTGWRFAEHQYDYIGSWNTSNWVDLFGWGTWGSGKNPLNTSSTDGDYTWSTDFQGTFDGHSDWYTLSKDEWTYLFGHSTWGYATVNSKHGVIILPDVCELSINTSHDNWSNNTVNASTWNSTYEAAHAVFLPAAGYREKTTQEIKFAGEIGVYWSSTPYNNDYAYHLTFEDDPLELTTDGNYHRYRGYSVRLVRNAE